MTTRIKCVECEGRGKVRVQVRLRVGPCREMTVTCLRCDGAGDMPEVMRTWILEGVRLRSSRLARGLTQREAAQRLGVSIGELSQMEHGKTKPVFKGGKRVSEHA